MPDYTDALQTKGPMRASLTELRCVSLGCKSSALAFMGMLTVLQAGEGVGAAVAVAGRHPHDAAPRRRPGGPAAGDILYLGSLTC